jgi:DNA-binding MarR family transcriptional regulator
MDRKLGKIISFLYRRSQVYLGTALKEYELTAAEQPFLSVLQTCDGATQEELSSQLEIDKAATARTVASLEQKGYIERFHDEQDKRQNHVFLTAKAKRSWSGIQKELYAWNKILTKNIDDLALDTAYAVLLQMEKNINNIKGSES